MIKKRLKETVLRYSGIRYQLTTNQWDECLRFANEQIKQSWKHYNSIGSVNKQKTINEIAIGKAAEIAAYFLLKPHLPSIIYPDFNIYAIKNKGYEPDITNSNGTVNVHVKCCISNPTNPSWLFSRNDPIVKKSMKPNSWAYLFVVQNILNEYRDNSNTKAGQIKNSQPPTIILSHTIDLQQFNEWEEPYSVKHRQNKIAIYAHTLNSRE